jgi:hypothetical protein
LAQTHVAAELVEQLQVGGVDGQAVEGCLADELRRGSERMRRVSVGCVERVRRSGEATRLASLGRLRLGGLGEVKAREAYGPEQELCVGAPPPLQQRIQRVGQRAPRRAGQQHRSGSRGQQCAARRGGRGGSSGCARAAWAWQRGACGAGAA